MTQELDKRGQIANQKRIHGAISLTAEERYLELLKSHPVFFQRFPQNMIASYLGISAETLSRIRKNALSRVISRIRSSLPLKSTIACKLNVDVTLRRYCTTACRHVV